MSGLSHYYGHKVLGFHRDSKKTFRIVTQDKNGFVYSEQFAFVDSPALADFFQSALIDSGLRRMTAREVNAAKDGEK